MSHDGLCRQRRGRSALRERGATRAVRGLHRSSAGIPLCRYDLAVSLLRDLQALAERDGHSDAFSHRFGELRARHERKPTLQERFDRAGLPG